MYTDQRQMFFEVDFDTEDNILTFKVLITKF